MGLQEHRPPKGPARAAEVAPRGRAPAPAPTALGDALLAAWRTNQRVTAFLVRRLPAELWDAAVPEAPRKTVRAVAAHLHNTRCSWIRTLGRPHGVEVPAAVDRRRVTPRQLVAALGRSGRGIEALLRLGLRSGGAIPPTRAYVWRNLPLDVAHVLTYFVAHEAHHRGQLVLVARQLGHRLPAEVTAGLWQWTKRAGEQRLARSRHSADDPGRRAP